MMSLWTVAIEILIYSYSVSCVFSIEYQLHPGGAAPRSPAGPLRERGRVRFFTRLPMRERGRGENAERGGVPV